MGLKELKLNTIEFYESGKDDLEKDRFNSAASDFFKALVTLCDYLIYRKSRTTPENHKERFKITKGNFPTANEVLNCLWEAYIKSHNERLAREETLKIKKGAEKVAKANEVGFLK